MPIVVGIDEVGYGPRLGPLVVAAVAFRVEAPDADLWQLLAPLVARRRASPATIVVRDSKMLYQPSRGIGPLEATAAPFLALTESLPALHTDLIERLAHAPLAHAPWYHEEPKQIPVVATEEAVVARAAELRTLMERRGVALEEIVIQYVDPARFNDLVARSGNKADVLFDLVAGCVAKIAERRSAEEFVFHIGKQGGKNFYLRDILRMFGGWGAIVEEEGRSQSRYTLTNGDVRAELRFLIDGEERHFAIALASIIGKYLREVGMLHFNRFWGARVPSLRPTSGYLPDADRFLAAIAPSVECMNLDRTKFVRIK